MGNKWPVRILLSLFVCLLSVALIVTHLQTVHAENIATDGGEFADPATALTPVPTAEGAEVFDVQITNTYTDQQFTPQFHVVGTITNNGNVVYSNIQVTLQITDSTGKSVLTDYSGSPLQSDEIYLDLSYVWPQETVPFDLPCYTSAPPGDISVVITYFYDSSYMDTGRANVRVENQSFRNGRDGFIYMTGELVNLESSWVDASRIVGVTLGADGTILSGILTVYHRRALAPAGDPQGRDRTPFIVYIPDPGVEVADVRAYFDPTIEEGPTNWFDVEVTNTYYDSLGYYHVVGWLTNNGSEPWLTDDVIAGLYSQDGKILDVGWGYMLGDYLAPGERIPFDAWVPNSANLIQGTTVIDHMTIETDGFRSAYLDILVYVPLTANDVQIVKEPLHWTVSGTVTNTSGRQLRNGEVLIAVYDETGKLVARGDDGVIPPGERWFPGETLEFSSWIFVDPEPDTTGYTVGIFAQGWYAISDEQTGSFRPSGPFVPEITTYIPRPSDLSTEPKVVGGNLFLAALIMLPFAIAAELFTRTLGKRENAIKPFAFLRRFSDWLENKVGTSLHQPRVLDILKLVGVLFFYGLVFSLLEPGWKPFSSAGISLFLYMTLAYGLVGLADDILQWRKLRKWGEQADFAIRPTNIVIAVISVAVSRIFSLLPGLLFGTPEALRAEEEALDAKKRGKLMRGSALTAVVLILLFWLPTLVTGMLLKGSLSATASKIVGGIEAFLLVIFAVALENTFVRVLGFSGGFGQALRKKNRWLWFVALIGATFLFLHTLLNPRGDLSEAMEEGNVILFLVVSIGFMVVAFIMWAIYGRERKQSPARTGVIPPVPPGLPPLPPDAVKPVMPPLPPAPPPIPGEETKDKNL